LKRYLTETKKIILVVSMERYKLSSVSSSRNMVKYPVYILNTLPHKDGGALRTQCRDNGKICFAVVHKLQQNGMHFSVRHC